MKKKKTEKNSFGGETGGEKFKGVEPYMKIRDGSNHYWPREAPNTEQKLTWDQKESPKKLGSSSTAPDHSQAHDPLSVEKLATTLKKAGLIENIDLRAVLTFTIDIMRTQTRKSM